MCSQCILFPPSLWWAREWVWRTMRERWDRAQENSWRIMSLFCTPPVIMDGAASPLLKLYSGGKETDLITKKAKLQYLFLILLVNHMPLAPHLVLFWKSSLTSVTFTSWQVCFPPLWLSDWLSSPVSWCLNSLRLSSSGAGCVVPASAPCSCLYAVVGRVWVMLGSLGSEAFSNLRQMLFQVICWSSWWCIKFNI